MSCHNKKDRHTYAGLFYWLDNYQQPLQPPDWLE